MRIVTRVGALAALLALSWSAFWAMGALLAQQSLQTWFDEQAAAGIEASHGGITVSGFPLRFDVEVRAPRLADAATGTAWQAPWVRMAAAAHRPQAPVLLLPDRQELRLPGTDATLLSDRMQAGMRLGNGTALAVLETTLQAEAVTLVAPGWQAGVDRLEATTLAASEAPARHSLRLDAEGIAPDPAWLALLAGAATPPPDRIALLQIRAELAFDRAFDRFATDDAAPRLTGLVLDRGRLDWGAMALQADGALTLDDQGVPEGRITFRLTDWRQMLGLAVAGGWLDAAAAPTWERALALLEAADGSATLDVPLVFRNGRMSLGPLPLGPAPRFRAAPGP